MTKEIKLLISSSIGLMVSFLGETSAFVEAIFVLVVLDIITGMLAAKFYRNENLSTRRFLRKVKELGLFGVGLASFIVSNNAFLHIGISEGWMAGFFCSTYIFYELFSILENLGDMDFPIAKQIKKTLQSKTKLNFDEEKNDKPTE